MKGVDPSNFTGKTKMAFKDVTYSYKEGLLNGLEIVRGVLIFALISIIISLIIGIRKKDCVAILLTNIMVKTVAVFLYQIVDNLLYFYNIFSVIIFFIVTIILEGLVYRKVLKYNKHNGMTVSIICNIGTVISIILMGFIFYL